VNSDNTRTIDHAAVVGVALAGVLSIAFEEGAWSFISLLIGVILLLLILGFYRMPDPEDYRTSELYGLAAGLTLPFLMICAWPIQLMLPANLATHNECERTAILAEAARARMLNIEPAPTWADILHSKVDSIKLTGAASPNQLLIGDLHQVGDEAWKLCLADEATALAWIPAPVLAGAAVGTAVAWKRSQLRRSHQP